MWIQDKSKAMEPTLRAEAELDFVNPGIVTEPSELRRDRLHLFDSPEPKNSDLGEARIGNTGRAELQLERDLSTRANRDVLDPCIMEAEVLGVKTR